MTKFILCCVFLLPACSANMTPVISDGEYVFKHRFAEHPNMDSIDLNVAIHNTLISVHNESVDSIFPLGLIDAGELFWHSQTQQWIIVNDEQDRQASDVGGCSGGPGVVDLVAQEYWTC